MEDTRTLPVGAALEKLPPAQRQRVEQLLREQRRLFSSDQQRPQPPPARPPILPETDKVTTAPLAAQEPAVTMAVRLLIPKKATSPHLTPVYIASLLERHGRLCRHIYYLIDGKRDIIALSMLRRISILEVKYLIQLLINDGLVEMTYQDVIYTSQQADPLS
jgi:hypothetical protein